MENLNCINKEGIYRFSLIRNGEVIDFEEHNLVTIEGRNNLLDVYFGGGTKPNLYMGLFTGNITPTVNDQMSTILTTAIEFTSYAEATREILVPTLNSTNASVNNFLSKAEFTINGNGVLKGAFLSTVSTKNSTSGSLFSIARFGADRNVVNGDVLQVSYELLTSSI